ncbi:hypothetical protein KM176_06425 [Pseudooceanicola sp. CBS1P-1]|uniref:Uncharacterized protein n=1 Tax=Pseudooceanicola albus TaxID=2692189 RepID=A0A6L7G3Y6_9RHOB|nr:MULTISPECIES: hypothetical protein [Pseudooceanicola]MBT9383487.1 hypothetical protein [Pseudooceanicola endophyticus]MXN17343.1 hypothetical protein [Pseudooceanicola albus]
MGITVHTLDARNNIFLEVLRDHFKMTPEWMHREIQGIARSTSALLAKKGVDYDALRTALVPQQDRHEAAFLFNIDFESSDSYHYPVHQRLLRLFGRQSSHSVLHADITDERRWGALKQADEQLVRVGGRQFESPMLYAVYVNNLTDQMLANIHGGFEDYPCYVGHVDTTFSSIFKAWLSTQLGNAYVQFRGTIIGQHEDDRDALENIDLVGFGFKKAGYTVRSIPGTQFMLLLSYKIERPVVQGYEADTEFSLNAISPVALPLGNCDIEIDPRKFEYLSTEKAKSLEGLGLLGGNLDQLREMISERISHNYIYSMVQDDAHGVSRFNIMIEARPTATERWFRALVGLEYKPESQRLRLITLI